jgi:hypothetical protein
MPIDLYLVECPLYHGGLESVFPYLLFSAPLLCERKGESKAREIPAVSATFARRGLFSLNTYAMQLQGPGELFE